MGCLTGTDPGIDVGMVPDIAVYERLRSSGIFGRMPSKDVMECAVFPMRIMEVISPSQSIHDLMQNSGKISTGRYSGQSVP
uniref:Uncharacterized protein n=1 Tax=Candidatus Kentrum sp. LFY TaxID=2126342 RepID=A0A450WVB8_9GAMM|nr:MAG: hypothetical protein BECKLFY1418C_GA0070996_108312 [Candidatus Kentron sp. LFY]